MLGELGSVPSASHSLLPLYTKISQCHCIQVFRGWKGPTKAYGSERREERLRYILHHSP